MRIKHRSAYGERRAESYPSVVDQLDMLWHAMDKGDMPKVEPYYSTLKAVKDQFPKVDSGPGLTL